MRAYSLPYLTCEAVAAQAAWQIRRSDTSKPSGKPPGLSRIETIYASRRARYRACVEPSAKALRASRRAVRWARLDQTIRRSAASEPSGKTPGPSRTEPSAEAIRASRRTSRQARLEPKRHEQSVRQYAGPASIQTIRQSDIRKRCERAVGPAAGPVPNCPLERYLQATRVSRRASRRARLEPKRNMQAAGHVSDDTSHWTDTSVPSGSTPGPSRATY